METNKTAKTLQEAKNEVAKKSGFSNWKALSNEYLKRYGAIPLCHEMHAEELAISYAQSQTEVKDAEIKRLKEDYNTAWDKVSQLNTELLKVKAEVPYIRSSMSSDSLELLENDVTQFLKGSKDELESKEPLELQYYQAPDNSLISIHDYQHISTSQQKQCKPIFS